MINDAAQRFCSVCGRPMESGDFVTLRKEDYKRLLESSSKHSESNRFRRLGRSPIYRNVKLAEFILQCSETMMLSEIRDACIDRFGEKTAPSISAIQRFLAKLPSSFFKQ